MTKPQVKKPKRDSYKQVCEDLAKLNGDPWDWSGNTWNNLWAAVDRARALVKGGKR